MNGQPLPLESLVAVLVVVVAGGVIVAPLWMLLSLRIRTLGVPTRHAFAVAWLVIVGGLVALAAAIPSDGLKLVTGVFVIGCPAVLLGIWGIGRSTAVDSQRRY